MTNSNKRRGREYSANKGKRQAKHKSALRDARVKEAIKRADQRLKEENLGITNDWND